MKRVRITAKMRADIFGRHNGVCHICELKVLAGQDWDVSHEIPLEMGGKRPGGSVALPKAGADAHAILQDLGYPAQRIDELIGQGAVETA